MRIGLYFGSFNPIHIGHCIIASHIANHTELDQVWFVVSPQNPFKHSNSLLNEYQRLHLVRLAVGEGNKLIPSDIEFKLPRPSYTIDTLVYLKERYPSYDFSVILGADSFQNLRNWKNGELILQDYHLYVYPRPGILLATTLPANVHPVAAPLLEISSTTIREYIRSKKSIRYLVPEAVQEEIERTGYYR
jgi:nicotinate-nucleotide adenylyltransferase